MDYFAYSVSRFWYRLYFCWTICFSFVVIALYALGRVGSGLHGLEHDLGVDTTTAVLGGIYVLYGLTFYWLLRRRSIQLATLAGAMLFTLMVLDGLSKTDPHAAVYAYIVAWWLDEFFNGYFGLPLLMGVVLVEVIYMLMQNHFQLGLVSQPTWVLTTGTAAVGLAGFLFWRGRFIDSQEQAVSQLSGMLQSNKRQSETLIESLADGVVVINTEGKINLLNSAAARMVEWPINEATGIDAQLVVKLTQENGSEIPPEQNPFVLVLDQEEHINQTLQLTGRDGKKQIISLVISPVITQKSKTPAGAVAVIRDVSTQHAVDQQRTEFISTAAHEMRTPVAAIEGYLALALNDKVSTIDTRARGYLEKAHASTQHLGKLFQDLLTSSKAEDGRLSSHPQVAEMGAFMQQMTEELKFAAEKKGLAVEFVVGSTDNTGSEHESGSSQRVIKPLYYVEIDPDRMREVITNLFDNACKYTETGKISLGLTGDNDVVQVYVRDTGAGIPADDIPHLFQKFYRVDNSATRTIGGTGLGLFICRKIVELYHGRIWVESTLGKGSTFFIDLPRISTQRAQALQVAPAAVSQLAATPVSAASSIGIAAPSPGREGADPKISPGQAAAPVASANGTAATTQSSS